MTDTLNDTINKLIMDFQREGRTDVSNLTADILIAANYGTMRWERADEAVIDKDAYYTVRHNGFQWQDFNLSVFSGYLVERYLRHDYIRGRPEWIAKIVPPISKPLPVSDVSTMGTRPGYDGVKQKGT
jgi:hypothetical protein